ncbi:DMT family transporter [Nonomuraea gerenzanensis]|uniref:Permease of the drug/metabolite transporter (DMT) superfamily n=1 Tax=Nonomuraea gerenzanensis TaxID=93944 RepID=A0A1M4DYJ3_9ACTN|nr:EamA family transporter [Nonomuraea gerenzanensis]UBU13929.1 EamA family transporter [Nonomuraea gerenzanensis]SBO91612.1 Permease of the drug/metabolite transporter (DMT) superfamily [Nonomuraea gerenzanensis]
MRNGPLAVVGASVLWGTAGTAGLLMSADSVALAAARLVIGGAALALLAGRDLRAAVKPGLLFGAVAVAAYQLCFFAAVSRTGVAIGTVVAIGSGPVFTGLLSWVLHGRRPTRRWSAATAAAICGCAALIAGGGTDAGTQVVSGIALALLGGLLYAFYAVMAARAIGQGGRSNAVMGVMFGGAALIMVPVLAVSGVGWIGEPRALLAVLYLGLGTTALSYFLYGRGLRTTPVATAATLSLAEPAVAALLGLVVLGERLAPVSIAGLVLLGLSLAAVAVPERAQRRERTPERELESQP